MARGSGQERIGRVLAGKYRLDAVLGVGEMATVYAATHRTALQVAIKVLHPHHALRDDVRARFLKEAYNANRVQHPGVVRITDDDDDEGVPFLVMELLEGETLATRQARLGVVPTLEVCKAVHEVLDVLVAAHAQGVVHRDLKPENLFRLRSHHIKVLDFGIARALYDLGGARTKTGTLLGSPAFMPPEQARGRVAEIDPRTDLWALAATAYLLLSGRLVHEEETPEMMHVAAATKPARPVRAVAPHVPEAVAAVLDRALQFERDARWPSAADMRAALERAAVTAFGETLVDPDAPPSTMVAPPAHVAHPKPRTVTLVDPFLPLPPTSPTGTIIDPPNLVALVALERRLPDEPSTVSRSDPLTRPDSPAPRAEPIAPPEPGPVLAPASDPGPAEERRDGGSIGDTKPSEGLEELIAEMRAGAAAASAQPASDPAPRAAAPKTRSEPDARAGALRTTVSKVSGAAPREIVPARVAGLVVALLALGVGSALVTRRLTTPAAIVAPPASATNQPALDASLEGRRDSRPDRDTVP